MNGVQQYKIFYTQTATEDIEEKADYIAFQLHNLDLAEKRNKNKSKIPNRVGFKISICQNVKTAPIGMLLGCAIRVRPIGTYFHYICCGP